MAVIGLFVNLPIKDLEKTIAFWTGLGFSFDPKFTNKDAGCLIISTSVQAMLLTEPFFTGFSKKPIPDPLKGNEAILALSVDSRQEADTIADKALTLGGSKANESYDHGFMYGRSFLDPDSHMWEVFWMDPKGPPAP